MWNPSGDAMFIVSFVWQNGVIVDTLWEIGRPNPDSVYNDEINEYFHIEGIDNFPHNCVYFSKKGKLLVDNEKLFQDYRNARGGVIFDGRKVDTLLNDFGKRVLVPIILPSGKYEFGIAIYEDERHTILQDSISGTFCIIRTPCYNFQGCRGVDEFDPVLEKLGLE